MERLQGLWRRQTINDDSSEEQSPLLLLGDFVPSGCLGGRGDSGFNEPASPCYWGGEMSSSESTHTLGFPGVRSPGFRAIVQGLHGWAGPTLPWKHCPSAVLCGERGYDEVLLRCPP